MRLPYLQVAGDAWGKARELGALLGCDRHRAISLMLDLWAWALELEPGQRAQGLVKGARAPERLAGALEWPGHPVELAQALCEARLLEQVEDGYRVRGLDRYQAAWDRQDADRQRKAGARQARRAKSAGSPQDVRAASAGSPQDVRRKPAEVRSIDVDVDVDVDVENSLTTPPIALARETGSALRDRLVKVFEEVRGTPYVLTSEEELSAGRRLLQMAQGERAQRDDEIVRRWRIALTRTRYPTADSLKDLVRHWNAYATEQQPVAAVAQPRQQRQALETRPQEAGQLCPWCQSAPGVREAGGVVLCGPCADKSDAYWRKEGSA